MKHLLFILPLCFAFTACVKDKPEPKQEAPVTLSASHRVYVVNEGNYSYNNAGVSVYEPSSGQVVSDYFKTQNNNAALGDVCQSIVKTNNSFYIVVNNSGKVVVVNADDFTVKGTVTGLTSPRYLLPITFQKGYVSDLNANAISVIDLNTFAKTGSIPCSGWTERMELIYNKAFVTNMRRNYVYVINTVNDQLTDSVNVGINAGSLVLDRNSKLWVLSAGDKSNNISGRLSRIDPVSLQVELSLSFGANDAPGNLCINAGRDTLYFLNTHVFLMPVAAGSLPSSPFVNSTGNTFYGIGVDPIDHTVYVSDAIDYIQKSTIMVYSAAGQLRTSFKAGINASGFYFE